MKQLSVLLLLVFLLSCSQEAKTNATSGQSNFHANNLEKQPYKRPANIFTFFKKDKSAKVVGNLGQTGKYWVYLIKQDPWRLNPVVFDSCVVDENGEFKLEVETPEMQEFAIKAKGVVVTPIFLKDKYEIMVDVTGTLNEPEVAFEGEGAKVNLFYQQFSKRFLVNDGFDYFYQNLVKENAPDEFATKWKKHMENQYAVVDSFMETKKPKAPKEFGEYMNSVIKYGAGGKLITYLYHKPQISQLQGTNYIQVQHEYYDFLDDYDLPALAEMENRAMNDFLFSYMIDREMTGRNAGKQAYVSAYNYAKRNFQGEVRDAAMGHILTEHIKNAKSKEEYEQLKKNVEEYRTLAEEKFVANIDARFSEMGLMIPGFPAPDFTLENLNGEKVSLSDFKGKLVVLDFWGTWCGPCKQQLPYSKKIEEKYKDRDDVVFLFVALERGPKNTWKQFVTQNKLPGEHLYSRQDRQLLPYNIVSVPRYMLIDKEGNIYDANASRPSQNMEQQIMKALEA